MGEVIDVDFVSLRDAREQAARIHSKVNMTAAQLCMLRLSVPRLTVPEQMELSAALVDADCYAQTPEHIQLLADIYHMLEAF